MIGEAYEREPVQNLPDPTLPWKDRRQLAEQQEHDAPLRSIPALIPTIRQAQWSIGRSCELHSACRVGTRVDVGPCIAVVESIENFRFTLIPLPFRPLN